MPDCEDFTPRSRAFFVGAEICPIAVFTKNQKSEDFKKWQKTMQRSTSSKLEAKKYAVARSFSESVCVI